MREMDITYSRDAFHSYMIIGFDGEGGRPGFEEKMLENQDSKRLLKFHVQSTDGSRKYYYDITGLSEIENYLAKTGQISSSVLKIMIRSLLDICSCVDRYLLNPDSLLFGIQYIYTDSGGRLYMAYVPGRKGSFADGIRELAGRLMRNVNYRDNACVLTAYEFYRIVCLPDFSVGMLDKLSGDRAGSPSGEENEFDDGMFEPDEEAYAGDHDPELRYVPGMKEDPGRKNISGVRDSSGEMNIFDGKSGAGRDRLLSRDKIEDRTGRKNIFSRGKIKDRSRRNTVFNRGNIKAEKDQPFREKKQKAAHLNKAVIITAASYCIFVMLMYETGITTRIAVSFGIRTRYLILGMMALGCIGILLLWMVTGNPDDKLRTEDAASSYTGIFDEKENAVNAGNAGTETDPEDDFFSFSGISEGVGETTVLRNDSMENMSVKPFAVNSLGPGNTYRYMLSSSDKSKTGDIMIDIRNLPVVIGSSPPPAGISVDVKGVSRSHVILECDGNDIMISDLYSTNGTFINDERLEPNRRYIIKDNDKLELGDVSYIFQDLR